MELMQQGRDVNRRTRFLPNEINFKPTTLIYRGEVSIMVSSQPYTAVLLQSYDIYKMVQALFDMIWEISGK